MMNRLIRILFDLGYLSSAEDIIDLDEAYSLLTVREKGGDTITLELLGASSSGLAYLSSRLAYPIPVRSDVVPFCYVALATANDRVKGCGYAGACLLDIVSERVRFSYTAIIPWFDSDNATGILIRNALEAILLVKPFFKRIADVANAGVLTTEDVFQFDTLIKEVKIHTALRFALLSHQQKDVVSTWLSDQKLSLASVDVMGRDYCVYPVVTDTTVSILLSDGVRSWSLAECSAVLNQLLREQVDKAWMIYLSLMTLLGVEVPDVQKLRGADDLFDEIMCMLD